MILHHALHHRFISVGGWDLLNSWLDEARKAEDNQTFVIDMLKVYQQMPVTVDLLKKNSCAKTIKSFSKDSDESE